MLIETLKKDSLRARKNKDTIRSNLLITLISDIEMKAKNDGNRAVKDEDCVATLKKFQKSAKENIEIFKKANRDSSQAEEETEIIEGYLPKQLSEEELKVIIDGIVAALPEKNPKLMGKIMGELNQKYSGQFDGKSASQLAKAALS